MKINDFRIQNYKSWNDSGMIKLHDGFNVIVGQNNTGKTALLEGIGLQAGQNPHRTLVSKPDVDSFVEQFPKLSVTFEFGADELLRATSQLLGEIFVPIQRDDKSAADSLEWVKARLKEKQVITVCINKQALTGEFEKNWYSPARQYFSVRLDRGQLVISHPQKYSAGQIGINTLERMLIESLRKRIYLLRAERYNTGNANISNTSDQLEQNCGNLAHVLHSLKSANPSRFNKIVALLKKVFPQIQDITIPIQNTIAYVHIWTIDSNTERKDLAVPLSESGTGIGQVLAMLYLIIHSDTPQILLIDEPQSFLHPGAIRSLMEILYEHKRHQYIITTHSPYILSFPFASVIHITQSKGESKAEVIDEVKTHNARILLQDIGFKLSDVFGADHILWVEGPTEETCIKLILRKQSPELLYRTEILGVRSTGKIEGDDAESSYDIYTKVSSGLGIVPPAIAFILDREGRTESQMNVLIKKSKEKVTFLPRRMYENYILDPDAIATLLNSEMTEIHVSGEEVTNWIKKNGNDSAYIKKSTVNTFEQAWLRDVHASKLLTDLFNALSKTTVTYRKVKYGEKLTQLILEKDPSKFYELTNTLRQACGLPENIDRS